MTITIGDRVGIGTKLISLVETVSRERSLEPPMAKDRHRQLTPLRFIGFLKEILLLMHHTLRQIMHIRRLSILAILQTLRNRSLRMPINITPPRTTPFTPR